MPNEYITVVTATGSELIAECILNGELLHINQAAAGDGAGEYYLPTVDQTTLKNEVWRGGIAGAQLNESTPNMIDVKVVIPDEVGGFTVRELGIFDDEGRLIAVCNTPAVEKISSSDGVSGKYTAMVHILVADSSVVEFTINPSLGYISQEDLNAAVAAHNQKDNCHEDIRQRIALNAKIALDAKLVNGYIMLELPEDDITDSTMIKFKAPCNSEDATNGLYIAGAAYTIIDATMAKLNGEEYIWSKDAILTVVLDAASGKAYLLNAATANLREDLNTHINDFEKHLKDKNNPHAVEAAQVNVGEDVEKLLNLNSGASVVAALTALSNAECSIASGAYVGHLSSGDANTGVKIEFPFKPKMVICMPGVSTYTVAGWIYTGGSSVVPIAAGSGGLTDMFQSFTFDGNTATLGPSANADHFEAVCRKDVIYRWVAFG